MTDALIDLSPFLRLVVERRSLWSEAEAERVARAVARPEDNVGWEDDDRWIYVIGPNREETALVLLDSPLLLASSRMIDDDCPPAVVVKTDDLLRRDCFVSEVALAAALGKTAVASLRTNVPYESNPINEGCDSQGNAILTGLCVLDLMFCSAT